MSLTQHLRPGGRHGLTSTERRDPVGYAVAALHQLSRTDVIDRVGLRRPAERAVHRAPPATGSGPSPRSTARSTARSPASATTG